MGNTDTKRKSNIDLLRILASMGVVVLHYNNFNIGKGLTLSQGAGNIFLWFMEGLCICAVNLFVLMSGYLLSTSQRRDFLKPVKLIVQVILFSEVFYLASVAIGSSEFALRHVVGLLIPSNWYVVVYVGLYLISPYINIVLDYLYKKNIYKRFVIIIVALYSVYPILTDILQGFMKTEYNGMSPIGLYGNQNGYTIINFIIMYVLGDAVRRYDLAEKISNLKLLLSLALVVILIGASAYFEHMIFDSEVSLEYCSPLVIAEAVLIFMCFAKMKFQNKIISFLAKSAFTVYLIHGYFINHIKIDTYAPQSLPVVIIHLLISIIIIYVASIAVTTVYDLVMNPIWKFIDKKIGKPLKYEV